METKQAKGTYIKINVEPSDHREGLSRVEIQAFDPQDFIVASLLGLKAISKKADIPFNDLLDLFCSLLRDKEVIAASMARIRNDQEDTLL